MDGFGGFDILLLALVAGFLILRLRSVLGQRTGNENPERWRSGRLGSQGPQPMPGPMSGPASGPPPGPPSGNVPRMPDRGQETRAPDVGETPPPATAPVGSVEAGTAQIRSADPSFDPRGFASGARQAFEMIVRAFAQGDTATL